MQDINMGLLVGLLVFGSLVGAGISVGRKYLMKKYSHSTILYIDTLIGGIILIATAIYRRGFNKLNEEMFSMSAKDLGIFVISSLAIVISIFIGLKLLETYDLTYLATMETGIDIIVTALVGTAILGEKLTWLKVLGAITVITGMAMMNTKQTS